MPIMEERKTKKTMSDIMARLAHSEKLARETLDRVKMRMIALTPPVPNNNNKRTSCCLHSDSDESDPTIKDGDYIEEVALAQYEQLSGDIDSLRKQSPSDFSSLRSQSQDNQFLSKSIRNIEPAVCVSKTWDLVGYHMNRISFHCECYFTHLSTDAMTKADKLHCQRFHYHCHSPKHHSMKSRRSKDSKRSQDDKIEVL